MINNQKNFFFGKKSWPITKTAQLLAIFGLATFGTTPVIVGLFMYHKLLENFVLFFLNSVGILWVCFVTVSWLDIAIGCRCRRSSGRRSRCRSRSRGGGSGGGRRLSVLVLLLILVLFSVCFGSVFLGLGSAPLADQSGRVAGVVGVDVVGGVAVVVVRVVSLSAFISYKTRYVKKPIYCLM